MTSDGIDLGGIDIHGARVYAIPMTMRFRGITVREGMLIEGPAGWGEFCPFREYDDREAASWLATAVEAATSPDSHQNGTGGPFAALVSPAERPSVTVPRPTPKHLPADPALPHYDVRVA